jgi:hypothetical protein
MVPEASVRLNKAIRMRGLQAAGVMSGMNLNGALSAMAHTSHGPETRRAVRRPTDRWHARFLGRARRKIFAGTVRPEIRARLKKDYVRRIEVVSAFKSS